MEKKYFRCYLCKTNNIHFVPKEEIGKECICCQSYNYFKNNHKDNKNKIYKKRNKNYNRYNNKLKGESTNINFKKKEYQSNYTSTPNRINTLFNKINYNNVLNIQNNNIINSNLNINNNFRNNNIYYNNNNYEYKRNNEYNNFNNYNYKRNNIFNNKYQNNLNKNNPKINYNHLTINNYINKINYNDFDNDKESDNDNDEELNEYIEDEKIEEENDSDIFGDNNNYNNYIKYSWLKKEKMIKDIMDKKKEGYQCSICLGNIKLNQDIHILKCGHIFHYKCIEEVIDHHYNKCPNCRCDIRTGEKQKNINNNSMLFEFRLNLFELDDF